MRRTATASLNIDVARVHAYIEAGLTAVPCRLGYKWGHSYVAGRDNKGEPIYRQVRLSDHIGVDEWYAAHPERQNLAVLGLVQADGDSERAIRDWYPAHGISSKLECWIICRGERAKAIFKQPADCPLSHGHGPDPSVPDLLNGSRLCMFPESIHPKGEPYLFAKGHSPRDIAYTDLCYPPEAMMAYWRTIAAPSIVSREHGPAPGWLALVFDAVCDHLEQTGHRLRPSGGGYLTTCPLHEDHDPSLSIHQVRGWKCWAGCGQGRLTLLAARLGIKVQGDPR